MTLDYLQRFLELILVHKRTPQAPPPPKVCIPCLQPVSWYLLLIKVSRPVMSILWTISSSAVWRWGQTCHISLEVKRTPHFKVGRGVCKGCEIKKPDQKRLSFKFSSFNFARCFLAAAKYGERGWEINGLSLAFVSTLASLNLKDPSIAVIVYWLLRLMEAFPA